MGWLLQHTRCEGWKQRVGNRNPSVKKQRRASFKENTLQGAIQNFCLNTNFDFLMLFKGFLFDVGMLFCSPSLADSTLSFFTGKPQIQNSVSDAVHRCSLVCVCGEAQSHVYTSANCRLHFLASRLVSSCCSLGLAFHKVVWHPPEVGLRVWYFALFALDSIAVAAQGLVPVANAKLG